MFCFGWLTLKIFESKLSSAEKNSSKKDQGVSSISNAKLLRWFCNPKEFIISSERAAMQGKKVEPVDFGVLQPENECAVLEGRPARKRYTELLINPCFQVVRCFGSSNECPIKRQELATTRLGSLRLNGSRKP
jgi:hypothetical protein